MNWTPPVDTAALIFDCDGTLADTMPIHFRAWTAMLSRHGIPFSETRFYQLGGMPTSKIIRLVQSRKNFKLSGPDRLRIEADMPDVSARTAQVRSVLKELT